MNAFVTIVFGYSVVALLVRIPLPIRQRYDVLNHHLLCSIRTVLQTVSMRKSPEENLMAHALMS